MIKFKMPGLKFPSQERLDELLAMNLIEVDRLHELIEIENELKILVFIYKEEVKNLDDDFLEDSYSAMGASAAYSRVIEDLEKILNLKCTSSVQENQHNKKTL